MGQYCFPPQQMAPLGAQLPSPQLTGNPGGQLGQPLDAGAHQPPGQQTLLAGQHTPGQYVWHSQMPASGPAPQQYPEVAS